ncbi:hypothetical protein HW532_15900 [Kaustia mangrovi]|uniref:Uncharacterized protein n=1 Tax=Kaustia mangrovi TaxID=2593653 RepID=A0A7S8C6D8_9HYPH|nr:hypothetical protein [Kaustia mangrovi]QPC44044.1 hypothetical protein HW532_15900 [Kaustia mangrovi]
MTERLDHAVAVQPEPMFVSEAELRRRLGMGEKKWRRVRAEFERIGMPPADHITGMWFWPAVKAFLYRRAGLETSLDPSRSISVHEKEYWDET